ncbi:unnamed protein product [Spirodela intermedia]|uniref:MACPF domain-containing protein n=1 Tax=Spirodela intermedia TaxID=51605 RepID=A0A7I8J3X3_SPIIN|nr:unnamed protein product [Spirodela intermedia]CAA6664761.1 unnamed protein product [Spirodela intermedia]
MGEEVVERALKCLGRGFDVTRDFRAKYCKGKESLVLLRKETRELQVPGFGTVHGVSVDIKCDKGERTRYRSDVLEFSQELAGREDPLGALQLDVLLQRWRLGRDAAQTKCLALDGFYISLFNLRIDRSSFTLADHVSDAVPSAWDPTALTRFIENYGTHVIVGLSAGGQDVVAVRQEKSSSLPPSEIKEHLDMLGDQLFTGSCMLPSLQMKAKENRPKVPEAFNVFTPQPVLPEGFTSISTKSRRDTSVSSHCEWLPTVSSMPDVINFTLLPITFLLKDVPGKGSYPTPSTSTFAVHKPSIADLEYFLEFQCHRAWAPMLNDHPLGPVVVGRRPVTGMRLHLEGKKNDRLAVHLQHISTAPSFLGVEGQMRWRGSEDIPDGGYNEAVKWKMFSHVCTAPVKYDPRWGSGAFIVAGAQLHAVARESGNMLHLRLLFAEVPGYKIRRSTWERSGPQSSQLSQRLGVFSAISCAERDTPVAVVIDSARLLKFVDTAELCKGPQDSPGFWLVTGARLAMHLGKICLHVKFSLLTSC